MPTKKITFPTSTYTKPTTIPPRRNYHHLYLHLNKNYHVLQPKLLPQENWHQLTFNPEEKKGPAIISVLTSICWFCKLNKRTTTQLNVKPQIQMRQGSTPATCIELMVEDPHLSFNAISGGTVLGIIWFTGCINGCKVKILAEKVLTTSYNQE